KPKLVNVREDKGLVHQKSWREKLHAALRFGGHVALGGFYGTGRRRLIASRSFRLSTRNSRLSARRIARLTAGAAGSRPAQRRSLQTAPFSAPDHHQDYAASDDNHNEQ
uniref:Uncharacterized protein n=1 Tax=Romanomermis culicivorax TaxID=13658 RepID=A0A915JGW1_ROMCU